MENSKEEIETISEDLARVAEYSTLARIRPVKERLQKQEAKKLSYQNQIGKNKKILEEQETLIKKE